MRIQHNLVSVHPPAAPSLTNCSLFIPAGDCSDNSGDGATVGPPIPVIQRL